MSAIIATEIKMAIDRWKFPADKSVSIFNFFLLVD